MRNKSYILKVALFATGLSGIVSEYILATLASYLLGDSIVQWALIISLMLFFMGIGARITKFVSKNEFILFILTEFALSLIVSFAALLSYSVAAHTMYAGLLIYILAIITGTLIGMELPLAVRLNNKFEALKFNISNILEKDYYGSLVGGLFFAFIGLPHLGLTYTPFVLGAVNLLVAIAMLNFFPSIIKPGKRLSLNIAAIALVVVIVTGLLNARDIIFHGEQKKYKDKIVYEKQTRYQKIVITRWKSEYWLYLNGNLQFASYDEPLYHEVLVHPAMKLYPIPKDILVLGGGDGCAARELLKYPTARSIQLVDIDPVMTKLAQTHPVLTEINNNAFQSNKVHIINQDAFQYVVNDNRFYDVIIIDLPDPRNVELARFYSLEFYSMLKKHLRPNGIVVTQAGSPYFAASSFRCILKTMEKAGFSAIPMHNQIITMGEWGWVLGVNNNISDEQIINALQGIRFQDIHTNWINHDAMSLITSFGKDFFIGDTSSIEVNTIHHPVVYRYFLSGTWDLY